MKRCDSQLQLPAAATAVAAADTSLMQLDSEADGRLSERDRIKRAKHNGGTMLALYTLTAETFNRVPIYGLRLYLKNLKTLKETLKPFKKLFL